MSFNRISVIGLGYIGLPTAAILASQGVRVIGVDISPLAVSTINRGDIHITEPGLAEVVTRVVTEGNLHATTQPEAADAFMIAVPTPFSAGHQPDLSYVRAAAESVAPVLEKGNLVVIESTCPVGSSGQVAEWLAALRPDLLFPQHSEHPDIHIAYCPERVLPGKILDELVSNDRVIGGMRPSCAARASELYRIFVAGECITTDDRTAELCKLTENSFRDVNIAFANELSMICDQQQINVWQLIALANRHPRVNILQPGPGVGGHCIAVDPWFIVAQNPQQARLICTAREVNDSKPEWVLNQVRQQLADCVTESGLRADEVTIACFGLAFKADIDDLRESPALAIVRKIGDWHRGPVLAVEPHVAALPEQLADNVRLVEVEAALAQADILVLLVDHQAFRAIDRQKLAGYRKVDTRGLWQ